jgi:hypothetical protein
MGASGKYVLLGLIDDHVYLMDVQSLLYLTSLKLHDYPRILRELPQQGNLEGPITMAAPGIFSSKWNATSRALRTCRAAISYLAVV